MLTFWRCSVVLYTISHTLGFTPMSDYQSSSSFGPRTTTTSMNRNDKNRNADSITLLDQRKFSRHSALSMATNDNGITNTTVELASRVETLFPRTEVVTVEMAEHVPLGCTVEESLNEEDDFIFISKLTNNGHAEVAGLEVGDVIVGVTGMFGELVSTIDADVEKIKRLVSAVLEEDPLTIQVVRGTNILERHESAIVDLCSVGSTNDKEVQDCVVDFLAGGYDYDDAAVVENKNDVDETECKEDEDAECLIDGMMNLWADELPPPSTTTGITADTVQKTSKPKPWSSRSSPSGTWVRDPKTGKMRNIDA